MDKSSFMLVFGDAPLIKILDFLLTFREFDYSIAQIASETETKWESVEKALNILIKKGIAKKTRKSGKAQLYMLDAKAPIAKLILEIDGKISDFFIRQELARQKLKVAA